MPKSMTNTRSNSHNQRISPRKFSEKIALLNQKEAEGNAAFQQIINEVNATCYLSLPEKGLSNSHQELTSVQYHQEQTGYKRPKSCEVPNINVSRVIDDHGNLCPQVPISSSAKSLPDLSDLRFQSSNTGFVHSGNQPTDNEPRFMHHLSQTQTSGNMNYNMIHRYDSSSNLHVSIGNGESELMRSYDCNYDSPGYVENMPMSNGSFIHNDSSVESSNSSNYKCQAYVSTQNNHASFENNCSPVTNDNNNTIGIAQSGINETSGTDYANDRYDTNFLTQPNVHQPLARSSSATNAASWVSQPSPTQSSVGPNLSNPYDPSASTGPIPITRSNSHNCITYYQQQQHNQSPMFQQQSFSHQCSPTRSGAIPNRSQVRVCDSTFSETPGSNNLHWSQNQPILRQSTSQQYLAPSQEPSRQNAMNQENLPFEMDSINDIPTQGTITASDIPDIVLTGEDSESTDKTLATMNSDIHLDISDDLDTNQLFEQLDLGNLTPIYDSMSDTSAITET